MIRFKSVVFIAATLFYLCNPIIKAESGLHIKNSPVLFNYNQYFTKNQLIFSSGYQAGKLLSQSTFIHSMSYRISVPFLLTVNLSASKSFNNPMDMKDIIPGFSIQMDYTGIKDSKLMIQYGNKSSLMNNGVFDFQNTGSVFFNDASVNFSGFNDMHKNFVQLFYERTFFNGMMDFSIYYGNTFNTR